MVSFKSGVEALPLPSRVPSPSLSEIGQAILNLGQSLNQGDVMEQNLGTWSGEFRNAYGSELRSIAYLVRRLQNRLSIAQRAFEAYHDEFDPLTRDIEEKQGEWDEALSAFYAEQEQIEEQWKQAKALTQSRPGNYIVDDQSFQDLLEANRQKLKTVQDEIARAYNKLVVEVDGEAQVLADALIRALAGFISDEVAATAGSSGGVDRVGLGRNLFGYGNSLLAAQVHWEYANQYAPEAAAQLQSIMMDDLSEIDLEKLKEWERQYGDHLENPFFATRFFAEVDPEQVYEWVAGYSEMDLYREGQEAIEAFSETFGTIGTALTIASGGEHNSDTPPSVWKSWEKFSGNSLSNSNSLAEWRSEFNKKLIELGPQDFQNHEFREPVSGYSAMTSIMAMGNHYNPDIVLGGDFLNGVGGDRESAVGYQLVKWDYGNPRMYGNPLGVRAGLFSFAFGEDNGGTVDPVFNMLRSMGSDVDSTREFFAQDLDYVPETNFDVSGGGTRKQGMVEYLIGGRPTVAAPHSPWPSWDGGRELGELIAGAAAMPEGVADEVRVQAQDVTLQYLRGFQSGLDSTDDSMGGRSSFGYFNSGLAEYGGYILDDHIEGLATSMDLYTGKSYSDGEEVYLGVDLLDSMRGSNGIFLDMAFFAGDELRPSAITYLNDMVVDSYKKDLTEVLETGYGVASAGEIDKISENWGRVSHALTVAPGDANEQAKQALDNRNAQIHALVDRAADLIPYHKAIKNPVGKTVVSGVVDDGLADLAEAWLPTDHAIQASADSAAREAAGQRRFEQAFLDVLSEMPVEHWTNIDDSMIEDETKLKAPHQVFQNMDPDRNPWDGSEFISYRKLETDDAKTEFSKYVRGGVGHNEFRNRHNHIRENWNDLWTDREQVSAQEGGNEPEDQG